MLDTAKNIADAFNTFLEEREYTHPADISLKGLFGRVASIFDQKPYTPFEKEIVHALRRLADNTNYRALYVSIRPDPDGRYGYLDPDTRMNVRAEWNIWTVSKKYSLDNAVRLERSTGYKIVMALDPHKTLQEQLRGWTPGTMDFPIRYLTNPVISLDDPYKLLGRGGGASGIVPSIDLKPKIPARRHSPQVGLMARKDNGQRYHVPSFIKDVLKNEL